MWKDLLRAASASALLIGSSSAMAADLDYPPDVSYDYNGNNGYNRDYRSAPYAGGVDHAYRKLERHGFYEISLERASIPLSFQGCKHDKRYHIHIDQNGDLEELNLIGPCQQYGYGYDDRPHDYSQYHRNWRDRVYRRARYSY